MDEATHLPVYLVRHGKVQKKSGHLPDYNAPLTPEQPALQALRYHLDFDADWHVSPLTRAIETSAILSPDNMEPQIDDRLEEQNFGLWHGKSLQDVWQEIANNHQPRHPASFINPDTCPPNGTSFVMIYDICADFLSDLIARKPTKPQIIICHAHIIKALLAQMMGLSAHQALMLQIDHGSVSRADYIWQNNMPETVIPWHIHYINKVCNSPIAKS